MKCLIKYVILLGRTLLTYLLVGSILLVLIIPIVFFMFVPERWRYDNKLYFFVMRIFYKSILWATFVPVTVDGKENLPNGPAIFVPNHQSTLDVLLVGMFTRGYPHIWLAKIELAAYNILGFFLRRIAVLIDMSTPQKGLRSLRHALALAKGNRHLIIFPEGGRYIDGKIHDFFSGFVILAKRTGRPVIPVLIVDAYKAYPPGSFFIYRHPVTVRIGEAFTYEQDDTDELFKERVYQWFVQKGE